MKKGINISHVNIENMGGRDQSQVKNKSLKSSKKVKSVPKTYQKVITMTEGGATQEQMFCERIYTTSREQWGWGRVSKVEARKGEDGVVRTRRT